MADLVRKDEPTNEITRYLEELFKKDPRPEAIERYTGTFNPDDELGAPGTALQQFMLNLGSPALSREDALSRLDQLVRGRAVPTSPEQDFEDFKKGVRRDMMTHPELRPPEDTGDVSGDIRPEEEKLKQMQAIGYSRRDDALERYYDRIRQFRNTARPMRT